MFVRAASGTVIGITAHEVMVEAHRGRGLPQLLLIGLARGAVKESAIRVRAALTHAQVPLIRHKIVLNLLPAELPKEASALDLALAAALLAISGVVPAEALAQRRFYGELSLGGGLEAVGGAVLIADLSRIKGDVELLVSAASAQQAAIIPGVRVVAINHLDELIAHLNGTALLAPVQASRPNCLKSLAASTHCLSEVIGQSVAKKALEVAAAGNHNMLMVGPPGSGKTMLASRLPTILPPLLIAEQIEITRIRAAAEVHGQINTLLWQRPFRAPHHTASDVALCGGGARVRPGEITLAHRGVLFLDELAEFSKRALEALREPLERHEIHVARAQMSVCFPAAVLLIAATNPCPCGHFGNKSSGQCICMCPYETVMRYRSRLSGPLLDRIDLQVEVAAIPYHQLFAKAGEETSNTVQQRVIRARKRQSARLGEGRCNSDMSNSEIHRDVPLQGNLLQIIEQAMQKHNLSGRTVLRILKVARTLADLEDHAQALVTEIHLQTALMLRLTGSLQAKNMVEWKD